MTRAKTGVNYRPDCSSLPRMSRLLLALLVLAACSDHAYTTPTTADAPAQVDADPALPLPALPLSASGRWIVDANGHRFKLASVNWYGAEEQDHVVAGLERADLHAIARTIRAQGFNSVRLPWSNELV